MIKTMRLSVDFFMIPKLPRIESMEKHITDNMMIKVIVFNTNILPNIKMQSHFLGPTCCRRNASTKLFVRFIMT